MVRAPWRAWGAELPSHSQGRNRTAGPTLSFYQESNLSMKRVNPAGDRGLGPRAGPQLATFSLHLVSSIDDCGIDLMLLLTSSGCAIRPPHVPNGPYVPHHGAISECVMSQGHLIQSTWNTLLGCLFVCLCFPLPVGFTLNRMPLISPNEKLKGSETN